MSTPSPYGPDRSLLAATGVLIAVLLLGAGAVYLLSGLSTGVARGPTDRLADVRHGPRARSVAPGRARSAPSPRVGRRGIGSRSPVGGGVPSWAGESSGRSGTSEGGYDLNADLGHADLGSAPTTGRSGGAVTSRGRASGTTSGGGPSTASAGPSVDVGRSSASGGGGTAAWRSELRRLGGRMRALSGALAALDRSGEGGGSSPRAETASEARASGGGAAATANRDPGTPPNPVPVDDHLPWLLAVGLLWGVWRLTG